MSSIRAGWKIIAEKSISGASCGRNIYVKDVDFPVFDRLRKIHGSSYHLTTLFRCIIQLNSVPHQKPINHTGTLQRTGRNNYQVDYHLDNGDILIDAIFYQENQEINGKSQSTGLYQTKCNSLNDWATNDTPANTMDLEHKWSDSHYAAVSGKFQNSNLAGSKIIDHIDKAYGGKEVLSKDIHIPNNHYSLYWVKENEHKKDNCVNGLSSLIQQAADKKASVNWLIHGEGAGTLVRSLEVLQTTPSLSRYAAQDEMIVRNIQLNMGMQKVFISNPRGATANKIELLCKKVGLDYVGTHINPRDMYSAESWRNTAKELKTFATKNAGKFATAGTIGVGMSQSGFGALDKSLQFIASHLDNPMMIGVGVGVTIIAANNAKNKVSSAYQAVNAMVKSSFGDANQRWYDNDKNLVA